MSIYVLACVSRDIFMCVCVCVSIYELACVSRGIFCEVSMYSPTGGI